MGPDLKLETNWIMLLVLLCYLLLTVLVEPM